MSKQLRVVPDRFYDRPEPTRYEVVLPPGVDGKGAKFLLAAAVVTAVTSKFGITPILRYLGILMLTTAGFAAILTASFLF